LSCACAPVRAAEHGVAGHCRPSDRRPHTPDCQRPHNPVIAPITVLSLIRGLPGLRRAFEPSICGPRGCGTRPGWCPAGPHWPVRRELCGPVDDRFRPTWRARRPRASAALSTGPSGCGFQRPDIRSSQQLLVHHPRDEGQDARPIHQSHLFPTESSRALVDSLPQKTCG
jgi:hypothetical protein